MTQQVLYTAQATATGGRDGNVKTSDGSFEAKLSLPKELGGAGGNATNPEQLFAAGYAACFENAVRFIARHKGVKIESSSCTAKVGIGPRAAGGFGLTVSLELSLPGLDKETAQALAEAAHRDVCPYSHATRGNLDVTVTVA